MPLTVHFLNVNRGDCSIIEFPSGHLGMVDICDVGYLDADTREELVASLPPGQHVSLALANDRNALAERLAKAVAAPTTDPVDYLRNNVPGRDLFRLIITHPHMDHMSGLDRLCKELTPFNFWHSGDADFDLADADWDAGIYREEDWERYKTLCASASEPKALVNRQSDTGSYWTEDGVEILGPHAIVVSRAEEKNDANIISQVLRVTHKGWSFVFGGDADADESWPDIANTFDLSGQNILKASHHGRRTGYNQAAVKKISPWLTITSVGQKEHDATQLYRQYSAHTVSLRFTGSFSLSVDDNGTLNYPTVLSDHWKDKL